MPSPDEIIQKFKESAGKESWSSPENDRDGAKLNKAVSDLRDLLDEDDMNAYSQKAFAFMEANKTSPSVGTSTCEALLAKGDLGKAVVTDVAKRVMTAELDRYSPDSGAFIRGQHAINGLTKHYIQTTSPDCERQVSTKVDLLVAKYSHLDQVANSNDWQSKTETTSQLGCDIVEILSTTPLSQESVNFLKEVRDSITNHQGFASKYKSHDPLATTQEIQDAQLNIADVVINNNAALRFSAPLIRFNKALGDNQLWKEANGIALSTFSKARSDFIQPKVLNSDTSVEGKPKVLSPEEIAENRYLADIAKNIHASRGMVLEMQEHIRDGVASVNLTAQKHRETLELESSLKPRTDKIASLEKRQADLNKAISLEKIKAFFSVKGVKGAKQEVASEILKTQNSVKESRTQLDTRFKNLKAEQDFEIAVDKLAKKENRNPKDLQTALQMPLVNKALMEFALKEHNAENLEFHQAVVDFKKLAASGASIEDLRNAAQDINRTFVTVGSPKEINISSTDRSKLEDDLNNLSMSKPNEQNFETWGPQTRQGFSEVFDQSDAAVLKLVKDDTFRRFTTDRSFKDAVTKSTEPPSPKVGQTTGINQQNSLKVDDPKVAVKSTKVGVG